MSGGITVFLTTQVRQIPQTVFLFGRISGVLFFLLKLLPYVVVWFLFNFIYRFVPNTRVSLKSALIAGLTAGTMYQVVQ